MVHAFVLVIVLCGGQSAVAMARFAEAKETFLRGFLKLANGIPSTAFPWNDSYHAAVSSL